MNMFMARASLAWVIALGGSGAALASGDCAINSNKPCPPPKTSSKEPAYKSLNSNQPTAQQSSTTPARADVQSSEGPRPEAKATLSGVSASDLKIKPKTGSTFEKEPATKP